MKGRLTDTCRQTLPSVLGRARKLGFDCNLTCEELVVYLQGPTYEDDKMNVDGVLGKDLFLLHEVVEVCVLKRMGYKIGEDTVIKAYSDTYKAHLTALRVELDEARRLGRVDHVERRCRDLNSYLEDHHLPGELTDEVTGLIREYCKG